MIVSLNLFPVCAFTYCLNNTIAISCIRKNMEDSHIACTEVANVGGSNEEDMVSLFGVFDGHGGTKIVYPQCIVCVCVCVCFAHGVSVSTGISVSIYLYLFHCVFFIFNSATLSTLCSHTAHSLSCHHFSYFFCYV